MEDQEGNPIEASPSWYQRSAYCSYCDAHRNLNNSWMGLSEDGRVYKLGECAVCEHQVREYLFTRAKR